MNRAAKIGVGLMLACLPGVVPLACAAWVVTRLVNWARAARPEEIAPDLSDELPRGFAMVEHPDFYRVDCTHPDVQVAACETDDVRAWFGLAPGDCTTCGAPDCAAKDEPFETDLGNVPHEDEWRLLL